MGDVSQELTASDADLLTSSMERTRAGTGGMLKLTILVTTRA